MIQKGLQRLANGFGSFLWRHQATKELPLTFDPRRMPKKKKSRELLASAKNQGLITKFTPVKAFSSIRNFKLQASKVCSQLQTILPRAQAEIRQ
jgi:hypothetical protein